MDAVHDINFKLQR